jgi:hypothetical protein
MAQTEANKLPGTTHITLVIPQKLQALYKVIADRRPNTTLTADASVTSVSGEYIVNPTENVKTSAMFPTPTKLLVDDRAHNAVRFVIYQR